MKTTFKYLGASAAVAASFLAGPAMASAADYGLMHSSSWRMPHAGYAMDMRFPDMHFDFDEFFRNAQHDDCDWNCDCDSWDDNGWYGLQSAQGANVGANANTTVDSTVHAAAINESDIHQDAGSGQSNQSANVSNNARTTVRSNINATSTNEIDVDQD